MSFDNLKLNEYQKFAERTASGADGNLPPLWYLALGLTGESGEVADLVKKFERHAKPVDNDRLADELGDVLWYIAILSSRIGLTLEEVASGNVEKLRRRYPDGFVARGGGAEADAAAQRERDRRAHSSTLTEEG